MLLSYLSKNEYISVKYIVESKIHRRKNPLLTELDKGFVINPATVEDIDIKASS